MLAIVSAWIELGIPRSFAEKLVELGLEKPTVVQREAIPRVLSSRVDALICAPTGTGKTEAALIPAILLYALRGKPISILYVTPLRALNRDIEHRVSRLAQAFSLSVAVWHGDTPSTARRRIVENPPSILITTPESLQVILVNQGMRKHLRNCACVIIDEAHEVSESERGLELIIGLNRLDVLARRHARRIALTAPYGNLEVLAKYLFHPHKYEIIDVGTAKRYEVLVDTLSPSDSVKSFLDALYALPKLIALLKENVSRGSQVLVFVNTRIAAEELGYALSRYLENVGVHHGSLSKEIRESVESKLKKGELSVAIATSSLELGIDIGGVDVVIQVMSPRQVSRLVQRVGRAGHREEATSRGVVLAPPMLLEILEAAVIARRAVSGELDVNPLHTNALDVVLHQVIGMAMEWGRIPLEAAFKILKASYPFSDLSQSDLEAVIDLAKSIGFATIDGNTIKATKKGEIYYRTTTTIVDTSKYKVKDVVTMKSVATLDEEFVVTCDPSDVLILGGKLWAIDSIDEESKTVFVRPVHRMEEAKLPRWVGENIPVSKEVAQEVCTLLEELCSCNSEECVDRVLSKYSLSEDARKTILSSLRSACRIRVSPNYLVIEVSTSRTLPYIIAYSCLGTRGSEALAILLAALINRVLGLSSTHRAHQIGTLLLLPRPLTRSEITKLVNALLNIEMHEAKELVEEFVESTPLYAWYLLKVARKMGLITKDIPIREAKRVIEGLGNVNVVKREALRELLVEKLDLKALEEFLNRIREARRVRIYVTDKPSNLAREIISLSPASIEPAPPITKQALTSVVLSKLSNRVVKLLCLSCLYSWTMNLGLYVNTNAALDELKNKKVSCPSCGSLAITLIDDEDELHQLRGVVKKLRIHGASKLNEDERKLLDRARKTAELIMNYGVAALLVLQGIGIGPATAKSILAKARDLDELVSLVLERKSQFLRTRRFWRS